MADDLTAEIIRRNQISRDQWARYTPHRRRVTDLILSTARSSGGQICILGAGNCNDVDLDRLLVTFSAIDLVDLDAQALAWGIQQQGRADDRRVTMLGGIDVAGFVPLSSSWSQEQLGDEQLNRAVTTLQEYAPPVPRRLYDVVVSVGLLSQLLDSIVRSCAANPQAVLPLFTAVRLRHWQLLAAWARPGGELLLVTELVSSDTCPQLASTSSTELPGLLAELLRSRNFFTGLHPATMAQMLQQAPEIAPLLTNLRIAEPWTWDFGVRTYACYAIQATKQGGLL